MMMAVVAIATSCSEEKQPTGDNWGTTEWYPDRFYYSYDPVRMTKTLEFEFNDDAREYLKGDDGYFELAISSSPQTYTKPTNIKVYYNDEYCEDGKFRVKLSEATADESNPNVYTADVGIEFLDGAKEGIHQYYIVYSGDMAGNSHIRDNARDNAIETNKDDVAVELFTLDEDGFYVEKIDVKNPVDVVLTWIGIIGGIGLAIWLIFGRYFFYPRIMVSRIMFTGPDTFNRSIAVKGCYKVVLTADRKKKQGLFARILTGKIRYIYDDVWTDEVSFEHRNKRSVCIHTTGDWTCDSFLLERHNTYTIDNMGTKKRGDITIV